jgi:cytochrome b561
MLRTKLRKVLDPLLALVFVMQLATGVLMERSEEHEGPLMSLHAAGALVLLILLVVHVANNWPMVRATWARKPKRDKVTG